MRCKRPSKKAISAYLERRRRQIGKRLGRLCLELARGEYIHFSTNADNDAEIQMCISVGGITIFVNLMLDEAKTLHRKLGLAIKDRAEERKYLGGGR